VVAVVVVAMFVVAAVVVVVAVNVAIPIGIASPTIMVVKMMDRIIPVIFFSYGCPFS
jgi:hypothetical protein